VAPHWTSYVGIATGIIGALTGITGAVLGYLGYRRSKEIAALDLRVQVKKARNDSHVASVQLVDLLEHASASRAAVSAATGRLNSGGTLKFKEKLRADQTRATELASEIPKPDADFSRYSPNELEKMLVELHRTQGWIEDMTRFYEREVEKDDKDRDHIRASHENRR
jgi:hypothetical protein